MAPKIVPFKMSVPVALKQIRALASDSGNVAIVAHARKRMKQRHITWSEVIKVLQKGGIIEGPFMDDHGCWRSTMQRFAAGEERTVIVSICEGRLVVVSAY